MHPHRGDKLARPSGRGPDDAKRRRWRQALGGTRNQEGALGNELGNDRPVIGRRDKRRVVLDHDQVEAPRDGRDLLAPMGRGDHAQRVVNRGLHEQHLAHPAPAGTLERGRDDAFVVMLDIDHLPSVDRLKVPHAAIGHGRHEDRQRLQVLERQDQEDPDMGPAGQHHVFRVGLETHLPKPLGADTAMARREIGQVLPVIRRRRGRFGGNRRDALAQEALQAVRRRAGKREICQHALLEVAIGIERGPVDVDGELRGKLFLEKPRIGRFLPDMRSAPGFPRDQAAFRCNRISPCGRARCHPDQLGQFPLRRDAIPSAKAAGLDCLGKCLHDGDIPGAGAVRD